jgi:hypothetical protein
LCIANAVVMSAAAEQLLPSEIVLVPSMGTTEYRRGRRRGRRGKRGRR